MKRLLLYLFIFGLLLNTLLAADGLVSTKVEKGNVQPGNEFTVKVLFDFPPDFHQYKQEDFFYITLESSDYFQLVDVRYPQGKPLLGMESYEGLTVLQGKIKVNTAAPPGKYSLTINAHYQICNDQGTCLLPQQEQISADITVAGSSSQAASIWQILGFLLFALIGGMILNVMPCVLPVLSIKALSLVHQSQTDKKSILNNSLLYTAGILVSFLILSTIVVILKLSGESVGWGFQFQNPIFVIGLAAVIFIFALSLFDLFTITAPGMQMAAKSGHRKGYLGSFLSGIFAVILATPCTAPFLGVALGFAFSQPPQMIYAILLMVGLGLSAPFLLIGFWPKAISWIPKPGQWMHIFKNLMGFLLLATDLWLINVLRHQISGSGLIQLLIYFFVLGIGAWLYGLLSSPKNRSWQRWLGLILFVSIIIAAFPVLLSDIQKQKTGQQETSELSFGETFSPQKVQEYRNQGFPVFIDFSAEWCLTCKFNETNVLFSQEIEKAFQEHKVKFLNGDFTNNDKTIGQWIKKFGKAGVPVYALYLPGAAEPVVFPELITKQMVLNALDEPYFSDSK